MFRNERLNGGIQAESKLKIIGNGAQKAFEAFYELRDGFVRMMVLVGERLGEGDWPGRRGTVISGSCRKLAVLPPFDSRESIFQVRSRLAH